MDDERFPSFDDASSSSSDTHNGSTVGEMRSSSPVSIVAFAPDKVMANGGHEPAARGRKAVSRTASILDPPRKFVRMLSGANVTNTAGPKMQWGSVWVATVIMFLVALQFSIYFSSLWPYMSMIDPTADQTFYGFTLAAYSFGQMISSPMFGFWNSRLKRARPIIAIGVCFSISGNLIYMFTEASSKDRKWIIMCARFISGIGGGIIGTIRGYLANASTIEHRARTIAIGTAALSLGITAGPVVQAAVTPIGYPGLVKGPLHISQYTAPAYVSVAAGLILLVFLFTVFKENYIGVDEIKKKNPLHYVPKYDRRAAALCILCWFTMFFCITNSETVESPYTMAVFNWTNSQAVFYNSIIMACSSFISFSMYTFYAIYGKRINERVSVIIGLCMLFTFYAITYPWPFYTGHLDFKSSPTDAPETTLATTAGTLATMAMTSATPASANGTVYRDTGCDPQMEWCNYTPRLPIEAYLISYPLISAGFPTCNVAISTLFSKILGPRRQGFIQSLMIMAGSSARLLGPILISWLFDKFGPRIAWTMTGGVVSISIFAFMIQFHRLVPLKMRPKLKSGQKLRYDEGILHHF